VMTKKRWPVFQEKNRGVTPSVAAPGVTHPSDATEKGPIVVYVKEVGLLVVKGSIRWRKARVRVERAT